MQFPPASFYFLLDPNISSAFCFQIPSVYMGSEVLTVVKMTMLFFWVMTP
jgi:hypothetical protein